MIEVPIFIFYSGKISKISHSRESFKKLKCLELTRTKSIRDSKIVFKKKTHTGQVARKTKNKD